MPFGLRNAPATYELLVNGVLAGKEAFCAAYLDDIDIYNSSWEEHLLHLKEVLQALQQAGLTMKASKYQIGQVSAVYLGHLVGGGKVQPLQAKIETVKAWQSPRTQTEISYGALNPVFSDKMSFPTFYQTVPNELSFFSGVAQLLRHFGWTWVGILTTDDDSGELALRELRVVVPQLNSFLQKVHFKTAAGDEVSFHGRRTLQEKYDILNFVYSKPFTFTAFKVGHLDLSAPAGQQLLINQSSIRWPLGGHHLKKQDWYQQKQGVAMCSRFSPSYAGSAHPKHQVESIPYGEMIRERRNCSKDVEFEECIKEMGKRFEVRAYQKSVIKKAQDRVRRVPRQVTLQSRYNSTQKQDEIEAKTPRSACSQTCLPGYRRVPIEGKPICCYSCVHCADGEFSNQTDMENCVKCPEDQWPNDMKDGCLRKVTLFLAYRDVLGACLATTAIVFSMSTAGLLGIFLRHQNTPIVKANNRDLSYALLILIMLTFLCSLLFIGRPAALTCLLQQVAFGIIFTVAVSCVLAKTITVVIAFNATRPGSRLSRWLGPRVSGSIVLLGTLGEVIICINWLITAPPRPGTDMQSETGTIILLCDQGSITSFYAVIAYMGLLAFASFIVAFLARNLPDRFNEAKHITFSMLVFCSVWVFFIPAYLSTKGRYMVAVEIFAILASSAGLLGCIFIPKCYIILLRPDNNTREHVTLQRQL
ncbi:vomeronasal type-2 receptor 26-like [Pleurodeles waltl]|uniref:vomeronasal type-2 receptor 26-like n=1 Tax=Pleurodeles waltl TaxID=8319 RepID=UPI00370964E4